MATRTTPKKRAAQVKAAEQLVLKRARAYGREMEKFCDTTVSAPMAKKIAVVGGVYRAQEALCAAASRLVEVEEGT